MRLAQHSAKFKMHPGPTPTYSNSNQWHNGHPDKWKPCNVYVLLGIKAPALDTSAHSVIFVQHVRRVTRPVTTLTPRQIRSTRL